jgi:prepilin-type N-terminal cleavage/methylation domain-containing protein
MRRDRGFSVLELLVAVAIMLAGAAAIFSLVDNSFARSPYWDESSDLHQRARVAAETVSAELRAAGAGTSTGPLHWSFATIDPRQRGTGTVTTSAITMRHVPTHGLRSTIQGPLPPGGATVVIQRHPGCAAGTIACGFEAGMDVAVHDGTGNWDTLLVQAIGPDALTLVDRPSGRTTSYNAGAEIVQIEEQTLYFDAPTLVLRREHPGVSDLPVVDNVVDVRFEYFGDTAPPGRPRPPAGVANCLYDSTGAPLPLPALIADHGALVRLPLATLDDGPMCGSGATAFDLDLLRIRRVRVTLRLQAGPAILRGADPLRFARAGTASASDRMLPDVTATFDVAPPNVQR